MTDQVVSVIRTGVPAVVGAILAYFATEHGVVIDEGTGAAGITFFTALATSVWYVVVRWVEQRYPQAGWLLGLPKEPRYPS